MDNTDIRIINSLQENCRISNRELGEHVGLTAPAVAESIRRLQESGVIKGFHAEINESKMDNRIFSYTLLNVPPNRYNLFCRFCEKQPSIVEHHHIIGYNNVLIKIRAKDTGELEEVLKKCRAYGLSNTAILLSTYFSRKDFPLEVPYPRGMRVGSESAKNRT